MITRHSNLNGQTRNTLKIMACFGCNCGPGRPRNTTTRRTHDHFCNNPWSTSRSAASRAWASAASSFMLSHSRQACSSASLASLALRLSEATSRACSFRGGYPGVDFLETHATRMTTVWVDSAAHGKHETMRHLSPACIESAKKHRNRRAPAECSCIACDSRHHRSAQRQNTAPSRTPRRRGRPQ